jgi:hypothetical protein
MLESQRFRQYAKDCIRLADGMNAKDRQTLLEIADAWEVRAVEAEKKEHKSLDGGKAPRSSGL